ncbi:MAG: FAD binding domain-containing protein, partial [Burkholderiales bacterium]
MTPFELLEPRTLREAARLLDAGGTAARPIAGGTAVMLMMKMGVLRPARLVSLRAVESRYSAVETTP